MVSSIFEAGGNILMGTVNELSNTIDMHTTLVQAEALFRRFRRTVEAVDRKHTFPAPSGATLRQRKPDPGSRGSAKIDKADAARVAVAVDAAPGAMVAGAASGNDARGDEPEGAAAEEEEEEEEGEAGASTAAKGKGPALPDVVSPELRALLDRERHKSVTEAGKADLKDSDAPV
jgi:TBC1 domain family member 15